MLLVPRQLRRSGMTGSVPLRDAIQRSGGTALEETWLVREDAERLAALMEQREA